MVISRTKEFNNQEKNQELFNSEQKNNERKFSECKKGVSKFFQEINEINDSKEEILDFEMICKDIPIEVMNKIIKCGSDCISQFEEAKNKKKDILYNTITSHSLEELQALKAKYSRKINDPTKEKTLVLELQNVLQFITTINIEHCDAIVPTYKGNHFICYLYVINRSNLS